MSITRDGERVYLDSPYSASNRKLWTAIGGKYNGTWAFHPGKIVEKALEEKFGAMSQLCTIAVSDGDERIDKINGQWQLDGYVLATKRSQLGETVVPEGVEILEGGFSNVGGTNRQPQPKSRPGERLVLLVVVRKSYALKHGYVIHEEDDEQDPVLSEYTAEALEAEIEKRRGQDSLG